MRLLIACPICQRQYSVAERRIGTSFHCHCGEKVEVHPPQGHDAAVVVCSSCGAPRQRGSKACGHCDSDFTLREQDLDTVCPQCLARISQRGRFCHHCGVRIAPELVRKRDSEHHCPVCESQRLAHRRLGEYRVSVLECQSCAGLWLPLQRFEALVEQESQRERPPVGPRRGDWKKQTGRLYRPCVVCGELMVRRNFGRGQSRVIIDICGRHGVWFDDDELAHLLAWVRQAGPRGARSDLDRLRGARGDERPAKAQAGLSAAEQTDSPMIFRFPNLTRGADLIDLATSLFSHWLRR